MTNDNICDEMMDIISNLDVTKGWGLDPYHPDSVEAEKIYRRYRNDPLQSAQEVIFEAIQQGRKLERAAIAKAEGQS